MLYVEHVPYPTEKREVAVSVGFERTDFAKAQFGDRTYSDYELLHLCGAREIVIQKLWTFRSLVTARFLLWLSYASILGGIIWALSAMAYQHALDNGSQ
jgi:hypothetical protein